MKIALQRPLERYREGACVCVCVEMTLGSDQEQKEGKTVWVCGGERGEMKTIYSTYRYRSWWVGN